MRTSKWLGITMAAALTAGGLTVLKTHAAERALERPGRGQIVERIKEKLGLTDEQIAKIKSELEAEKDTLKSLITRFHEARVGLREAIQASNATETSVRAAAAKVGAVQADLAVERFKLFGRLNPILTDEQREKVKQYQAQIDEFLDGAINRLGERFSAE